MADCRSCPADDRPFCPGSDKPAAAGSGTRYGYCAACHEPFVLSDATVPGHRAPDLRVGELLVLATTDPDDGSDTGALRTPCSRYGRTADDVAPWAVAAAVLFEAANGVDAADMVDEMMSRVVNDSDSVIEDVADNWEALPALREMLDGDLLAEHRGELDADDGDEDEDEDGYRPELPGQFGLAFDDAA